MDELRLFSGYRDGIEEVKPPPMGFVKMAKLAWRAWPFIRPMVKHLAVLIFLGVLGLSGVVLSLFMGTDIFTNKVLIGDKLQPLQAMVLLVGEEYVTTDPERLGQPKPKVSEDEDTEQADAAGEPELTPDQRRSVRNRLIIWGVIGASLAALFGYGGYYYAMWIWQSINQSLRVRMIERVETLSLKFHDEARVGDAVFRVYQDSAMIVNLLQSGIIDPILNAGILIGTLLLLGAFDPWLMLIGAVTITFMIVVASYGTPHIRSRILKNRLANSDLLSQTQETFTVAKLVKANGAEQRVANRFHRDSNRALNAAYFLRVDMVLLTLAVALVAGIGVVLAEYLIVSWTLVDRQTFLGGVFTWAVSFVIWNTGAYQVGIAHKEGIAYGSLGLLGTWMRIQDLFIALERAYFLLEVDEEVRDPVNPEPVPKEIEEVKWRDVCFGYEANKPLLNNLDLHAETGKITAIVGSTGVGKSTLMSLLLRLFDVDSGSVLINGIDVRKFKVSELRRHIAIALQKNVLFAETIANNISFGAPDATREQIEAAAAITTADEFIKDLPKGLDTELGERGGKLSSGQRQRLSIARAVVRDTPILILDEPTASLDARTEEKVLKNLAEWGENRLIFIITHRIATIRRADQIAFIENGEVAEVGTHEELVAIPNGRYRDMIEAELAAAEA